MNIVAGEKSVTSSHTDCGGSLLTGVLTHSTYSHPPCIVGKGLPLIIVVAT